MTEFLTLSRSKNPTACILLSIKGIKEECLTLKTKKREIPKLICWTLTNKTSA